MTLQTLAATTLFDGAQLLDDMAVILRDGVIEAIVPRPEGVVPMPGILAPGFVDLQVNGGAGLMVGAGTDAAALARICAVHRDLGCAGILPTLITDTPEATRRVIEAGVGAAEAGVPGFLGLHLEGPHLDLSRKGAHHPALIRPMTERDLALYLDLAQRAGFRGTQEWLSFYWKSPMSAPGLEPEHDLFIQQTKLKNTLRWMMGEDLITHLGKEYYE